MNYLALKDNTLLKKIFQDNSGIKKYLKEDIDSCGNFDLEDKTVDVLKQTVLTDCKELLGDNRYSFNVLKSKKINININVTSDYTLTHKDEPSEPYYKAVDYKLALQEMGDILQKNEFEQCFKEFSHIKQSIIDENIASLDLNFLNIPNYYCDLQTTNKIEIFAKKFCNSCDGISKIICNSCNGKGSNSCTKCGSEGKIHYKEKREYKNQPGYYYKDRVEKCKNCNGNGTIICSVCNGTKHIKCNDCDGSGINFYKLIPNVKIEHCFNINGGAISLYDIQYILDTTKELGLDCAKQKKIISDTNTCVKISNNIDFKLFYVETILEINESFKCIQKFMLDANGNNFIKLNDCALDFKNKVIEELRKVESKHKTTNDIINELNMFNEYVGGTRDDNIKAQLKDTIERIKLQSIYKLILKVSHKIDMLKNKDKYNDDDLNTVNELRGYLKNDFNDINGILKKFDCYCIDIQNDEPEKIQKTINEKIDSAKVKIEDTLSHIKLKSIDKFVSKILHIVDMLKNKDKYNDDDLNTVNELYGYFKNSFNDINGILKKYGYLKNDFNDINGILKKFDCYCIDIQNDEPEKIQKTINEKIDSAKVKIEDILSHIRMKSFDKFKMKILSEIDMLDKKDDYVDDDIKYIDELYHYLNFNPEEINGIFKELGCYYIDIQGDNLKNTIKKTAEEFKEEKLHKLALRIIAKTTNKFTIPLFLFLVGVILLLAYLVPSFLSIMNIKHDFVISHADFILQNRHYLFFTIPLAAGLPIMCVVLFKVKGMFSSDLLKSINYVGFIVTEVFSVMMFIIVLIYIQEIVVWIYQFIKPIVIWIYQIVAWIFNALWAVLTFIFGIISWFFGLFGS